MIAGDISDLRDDCTAFWAQLAIQEKTGPEKAGDDILRQEIARIGAKMLALTATTEGETSPIPALLTKTAEDGASHSKLITALREIAPDLFKEKTDTDFAEKTTENKF